MAKTIKAKILADISRRDQLHELFREYINRHGVCELLTILQGALKERSTRSEGSVGAHWNDIADCIGGCAEKADRLEFYND